MRIITLIIIFAAFALQLKAQDPEWIVPKDKDAQLSPFKFEESNVEAGRKIYESNCVSCHGHPGQGDFINLNPAPGDPATQKIQGNSDGAIHYKVTNGKGAMPSFKNILSSTDIWNVIAYLRTFNPDYAQEVAKKVVEGTFGAKDLRILLTYLEENSTIQARVSGIKDGTEIPVENAEVNLFAKRQFGNLVIDEAKRTDSDGVATFNTPNDLPGDTAGYIQYIAKLPNEDLYGTVDTDTLIKAGVVIHPVSARAKRAMWNTVQMAPIWILVSYTTIVITVWSIIFYIMFQIRKIYMIGKED